MNKLKVTQRHSGLSAAIVRHYTRAYQREVLAAMETLDDAQTVGAVRETARAEATRYVKADIVRAASDASIYL